MKRESMVNDLEDGLNIKLPQDKTTHIIKVIGVGGGGGNCLNSA